MSIGEYDHDRAWSDAQLPRVKALLGQALILSASEADDVKTCLDLYVLAGKIAVRTYREATRLAHPHDLTFRYRRPNGAPTEASKLRSSGLTHYFWGWERAGTIGPYAIMDVAAFLSAVDAGTVRARRKPINKATDWTRFLVYDLHDLPRSAVLACSKNLRDRPTDCPCRTCA